MVDLKSILQFVRHDPLVVLGFLLVGLSAVLSFIVFRRLATCGYKTGGYFAMWPMIVKVPLAYVYLKARSQHGWSAWPAYLVWLSGAAGMATLVVGLFRLPG
jgi:hypothetical protein